MIDGNDRLDSAKYELFRVVAGHVFGRTSSAPNVLDATLLFLKRRYPELWNEKEGHDLILQLRDVEASSNYETSDQMRDALKAVAAQQGMDIGFDRFRFSNR
jgi:hypothetical protein